MDTHKTEAERATAAADDSAASGVPPARTAAEQKHYDSLSPLDKQADDDKRLAAARATARAVELARLPKRTKDEQEAYDALSPADKHEDDDKRIAAARLARIETPEGRAAREAHEQAMKGIRAGDKRPPER